MVYLDHLRSCSKPCSDASPHGSWRAQKKDRRQASTKTSQRLNKNIYIMILSELEDPLTTDRATGIHIKLLSYHIHHICLIHLRPILTAAHAHCFSNTKVRASFCYRTRRIFAGSCG